MGRRLDVTREREKGQYLDAALCSNEAVDERASERPSQVALATRSSFAAAAIATAAATATTDAEIPVVVRVLLLRRRQQPLSRRQTAAAPAINRSEALESPCQALPFLFLSPELAQIFAIPSVSPPPPPPKRNINRLLSRRREKIGNY